MHAIRYYCAPIVYGTYVCKSVLGLRQLSEIVNPVIVLPRLGIVQLLTGYVMSDIQ